MFIASTQLKALTLICTLKPSPEESSSDKLARDLNKELEKHNIQNEFIRVVDYNIKPGVGADMGGSDDWPLIREKMLASDILIIATPTWVGQMSSVALRVVERLDAELTITDDDGRLQTFGKCAALVIVGNEDGAHKITADLSQALNDVGFSIPAQGVTYWNGEAMNRIDYKDLDKIPKKVRQTNQLVARNVAHLATLLKSQNYPAA